MRHLMQNRPAILTIIIVVVVISLAAAVVHVVTRPALPQNPDHVHIIVAQINRPGGSVAVVIFDRQLGTVARQIYDQLVAGQQIPANARQSCPIVRVASYYHYELTFSRAGDQIAVATTDAVGCADIALAYAGGQQETFSWLAPGGTSFWEALHQLAGAPLPINSISSV